MEDLNLPVVVTEGDHGKEGDSSVALGDTPGELRGGADRGDLLHSSHLQFGFKSQSSTTLCTALMKTVVARYINNGFMVLGCFLDASKAFYRVDHGLLFQKLGKRGLPPVLLHFLLQWYST